MPFDDTLPSSDLTETQCSTEPLFQGRVLRLRRDEALLPNGRRASREVVEHPGGVVVLPILDDGRIVMVEQFRYALGHTLLELPAGKREPGEEPFITVQRELAEETGYRADHWEEMTHIYTSPGFCNERLWLFKATGLSPLDAESQQAVDAVGDGEEFLHRHCVTPEEAFALIQARRIVDAKTICLLALCLPTFPVMQGQVLT